MFLDPGLYHFKSQTATTPFMRMRVEVREFAVRDGTMMAGGDLEVGGGGSAVDGGTLRVGGRPVAGAGFEDEVRFFIGGSCPPGWTEATEVGQPAGSAPASEAPAARQPLAGALHLLERTDRCLRRVPRCCGAPGAAARPTPVVFQLP